MPLENHIVLLRLALVIVVALMAWQLRSMIVPLTALGMTLLQTRLMIERGVFHPQWRQREFWMMLGASPADAEWLAANAHQHEQREEAAALVYGLQARTGKRILYYFCLMIAGVFLAVVNLCV